MPIEQDHHISLPEAAAMTANFRNSNPMGVKGFAFSKNILQEILNQPGCEGIRIYNAIDDNMMPTVVITGINQDDSDQYTQTLAEYARRCPDDCPPPNPLNS